MCQIKLSEKDYRICMEALVTCDTAELEPSFSMLPEQIEDLILRLSNNAEIAWLREQRSEEK